MLQHCTLKLFSNRSKFTSPELVFDIVMVEALQSVLPFTSVFHCSCGLAQTDQRRFPAVVYKYSTQVLEIILTALAKTPMTSGNWCVRSAIIAVEEQSPAVKWMKKGSSFFG